MNALQTLDALRALFTGSTCCTNSALDALDTLSTVGSSCTCRSSCALDTLRTLWTNIAGSSSRTSRTDFTLQALLALDALNALQTLQTLLTLGTCRPRNNGICTGRARRSDFTLDTLDTLWAFHASLRPGRWANHVELVQRAATSANIDQHALFHAQRVNGIARCKIVHNTETALNENVFHDWPCIAIPWDDIR